MGSNYVNFLASNTTRLVVHFELSINKTILYVCMLFGFGIFLINIIRFIHIVVCITLFIFIAYLVSIVQIYHNYLSIVLLLMDIQFGAIMNNTAMNIFRTYLWCEYYMFQKAKLLLIGYIGLAKCLFNKVLHENEKFSFIFLSKTKWTTCELNKYSALADNVSSFLC